MIDLFSLFFFYTGTREHFPVYDNDHHNGEKKQGERRDAGTPSCTWSKSYLIEVRFPFSFSLFSFSPPTAAEPEAWMCTPYSVATVRVICLEIVERYVTLSLIDRHEVLEELLALTVSNVSDGREVTFTAPFGGD